MSDKSLQCTRAISHSKRGCLNGLVYCILIDNVFALASASETRLKTVTCNLSPLAFVGIQVTEDAEAKWLSHNGPKKGNLLLVMSGASLQIQCLGPS